jgi:hypothetical protein
MSTPPAFSVLRTQLYGSHPRPALRVLRSASVAEELLGALPRTPEPIGPRAPLLYVAAGASEDYAIAVRRAVRGHDTIDVTYRLVHVCQLEEATLSSAQWDAWWSATLSVPLNPHQLVQLHGLRGQERIRFQRETTASAVGELRRRPGGLTLEGARVDPEGPSMRVRAGLFRAHVAGCAWEAPGSPLTLACWGPQRLWLRGPLLLDLEGRVGQRVRLEGALVRGVRPELWPETCEAVPRRRRAYARLLQETACRPTTATPG